MEYQIKGELLFFDCEQCNGSCMTLKGDQEFGHRTFCDNCGACYILYTCSNGERCIRRIKYGEMYLPPREWNEIVGQSMTWGWQREVERRRGRSFRERLADFIHNR